MNHQEAGKILVAFVEDPEAEEQQELMAHLESCLDCREWVEVYRVLVNSLGADALDAHSRHPASSDLARWSVDSIGSFPDIDRHLERCPSCRHLADLSRRAVQCARVDSPDNGRRRTRSHPVLERLALPAAAAVLLLVVAVTGRLATREHKAGSGTEISNQTLSGVQVISGGSSLLARRVRIQSFSDVRFQAEDVVALGDDFVVASGASFSVEITRSSDPVALPSKEPEGVARRGSSG